MPRDFGRQLRAMGTAELSHTARADALLDAVGLIRARRNGATQEELGRLIGQAIGHAMKTDNPYHALGWLIGQITATAAHAVDQWNETANGDPADNWLNLITGLAHAERNRS